MPKPTKQPETPMPDPRALVAELEVRAAAIPGELDAITEERRKHVLLASQGDQGARVALDDLSGRATAKRREMADLALALDEARQRLAEAEAAAKQAEADARHSEFARLAEMQHEDAREIDRLLASVGPARERMLARSIAMQKLGVSDASLLSRLHAPGIWQRALNFHGFGVVAGLRRDHSHHWQSLEAAVGQLVGRPTAAPAKAA